MGRRPKEITPEHIEQIERLAGLGLTEAAIAHCLGMHPATFWRKKNGKAEAGQDPELREEIAQALARGKAKAEEQVGTALFLKATVGDVPAIRWWEMTRTGRSEKQAVEHKGDMPAIIFRVEK